MAQVLIIVDATAKAEFLQGYYGDDAECVVCAWPLFRTSHQALASPLPGLTFQFDPAAGSETCIAALHAHQDHEIMVCLDDTARADYLVWQISGYLAQIGDRSSTVKQVSPVAFNRQGIETAIRCARAVDPRQGVAHYAHLLFDECLARHLVRLIGTDHGPGHLPLRQPTLTTLFLLADQERELVMFQPVAKWQVQTELSALGQSFTASLAKGLDLPADGLIRDESKARIIQDQVTYLPFVVDAIQRSPLTIAPPQPYLLAELVHDAKVLLGLNPATTMAMIKKLCHGVAMGAGQMGLISSYAPTTGGPTDEMLAALRRQVAALYGQGAPTADAPCLAGMIVPLHPELSNAELQARMGEKEAAVYELIRRRAISSQMRPAVGETITVDLRAGKKNIFQAHFHELPDPGFLHGDPEALARMLGPCPLPTLETGQELRPLAVHCRQVQGANMIAERYTIDTLFTALADFAITADPVTMTMLEAMLQAGYITISHQGTIHGADRAAQVVTLLNRAFPRMQGVNLSAYIEQTMAEVITGRKELAFALKQFDQTLMLHGKILVKAKIATTKIQPRSRTSSTIIKQTTHLRGPGVAADQEAATPPPATDALQPTAQAAEEHELVPMTAGQTPDPALAPLAPESAAEDAVPSPLLADEEPVDQEGPPETAAQEDLDSAFAPEQDADDAWPDDLKRVFAEALAEEPSAEETPQAMASPPTPDAGGMVTAPATDAGGMVTAPAPTDQIRPCPTCGRPMLLKEDPFGAFWGCSGFPGCRYSEAIARPDQGLVCPLCGQGLSRQQTPTGKSFYVCGQSDCQFMSWSIPHHLPCGLCDSPYLVEKSVRGVSCLHCPRAGCPYEQSLTGGDPGPLPGPSAEPVKKKILVRRTVAGATPGGGATKKVRVVRRKQ
jgi:DNA topoisomerase IA/ssDNA-binding Zn-finger/Zn-ribbon topoisomerase 1